MAYLPASTPLALPLPGVRVRLATLNVVPSALHMACHRAKVSGGTKKLVNTNPCVTLFSVLVFDIFGCSFACFPKHYIEFVRKLF